MKPVSQHLSLYGYSMLVVALGALSCHLAILMVLGIQAALIELASPAAVLFVWIIGAPVVVGIYIRRGKDHLNAYDPALSRTKPFKAAPVDASAFVFVFIGLISAGMCLSDEGSAASGFNAFMRFTFPWAG